MRGEHATNTAEERIEVAIEEADIETLKTPVGSLERTLQALRGRIEKLEGESKAK